jgi:hypothetical protein
MENIDNPNRFTGNERARWLKSRAKAEHGEGTAYSTALEMLKRYNAERCDPPLAFIDVLRILNYAYKPGAPENRGKLT